MKKILFRLAATLTAVVAWASSLSAQIYVENFRYRLEAGAIASQITNFGIGERLYGLRISGQIVMPFENSKWAIVSGLTFSHKGELAGFYEKVGNNVSVTDKDRISMRYLQLPVNFSHRFDLNRNHRIYFEFGPYLAYAVSGKLGQLDLTKREGEEPAFKPFEIGIGASLHYDYKDIYLKGGLEYSLTGVVNDKGRLASRVAGGTPRYGLAYITLGYQF